MTRPPRIPPAPVTTLFVDYGGVLSRWPTDGAFQAIGDLASRVGPETAVDARARYWEHRHPYDRGELTDAQYWSSVCGVELDPGGTAVGQLAALDVTAWSRAREESLDEVRALADAGYLLLLLSNTPRPHAEWMLAQPWAARFTHHVFSYAQRVAKPEAAIFEHALRLTGASPAQVLFVDDREDNIAGAAALGIAGVRFTGPESWREVRSRL